MHRYLGLLLLLLVELNTGCVAELSPSEVNIPATEPLESPIITKFPSEASTAIPSLQESEQGEVTPQIMNSANADVKHVKAVQSSDGSWTFYVTVYHPDTGWEDYVNGWDVVTSDGVVIKPDKNSEFTRLLLHPHVDEQPFTRSQSGIIIPGEVTSVVVRAHDLVDGFGGVEVTVDLTVSSGENFEVILN